MAWKDALRARYATAALRPRTRSERRSAEGKLHLIVAIDRTSKFVLARLEKRATSMTARAFLEALINAFSGKSVPRIVF